MGAGETNRRYSVFANILAEKNFDGTIRRFVFFLFFFDESTPTRGIIREISDTLGDFP